MLTLPLLAFLGVASVQVATSMRASAELDAFSRQVAVGREIDTLVHELQRERDRTVGAVAAIAVGEQARDLSALAPDRTAVDRAVAALDAAARSLTSDATFARAYSSAQTGLAELRRIRDGVQSGWLRAPAVFDAYSRIIADLHALLLVPAAVGGDASVGRAVRAFANASRAKELTAQLRGILYAVCSAGGFGPGELDAVTDLRARQRAAIAQFRADADAAAVTAWDEAASGQAARNVSRLEQTMVDNAPAQYLGVDPQQWWQASTTALERVRGAEEQLLESAIAAAHARSAQERRATQVASLLSLLLLMIALLTSFAIGRIMVRALHSLREQALDVAQRRLPEMIERLRTEPANPSRIPVESIAVRSADEVGEVAEAFTAVHRSAVRLAAEQAMMRHNLNAIHVNLARRSQALVERQLQLLDTLESAEVDPDQLANLFRLDHLATRMRRNDENLLVLAGGDTDRRWTEPIPLATVVLAAAAEIEQYPRVRHDIADNVHIVGHAVADLVHLVAELLENATLFSAPDTAVTVLGWASNDGGAALVVSDEGIGMSPDAVARANQQIAFPGTIDVAAAERMGLVVVGHLARRHQVRVRLRSGGHAPAEPEPGGPRADDPRPSDRGLSVLMELPAKLIADPPEAESSPSGIARYVAQPAVEPGGGQLSIEGESARGELGSARRGMPTRAEDVLGLGLGRAQVSSLWWSREPRPPAAGALPAVRQRPAAAITTGTGLPQRVPMAQLPSEAVPAAAVRSEADPDEVGTTLSRFYDGVHRAAAEDADLQTAR